MLARITSQPQLRMKSENPMRIWVRSGNAALEFSNWRTIFGTTNVSNIATIEAHTTNSRMG